MTGSTELRTQEQIRDLSDVPSFPAVDAAALDPRVKGVPSTKGVL